MSHLRRKKQLNERHYRFKGHDTWNKREIETSNRAEASYDSIAKCGPENLRILAFEVLLLAIDIIFSVVNNIIVILALCLLSII